MDFTPVSAGFVLDVEICLKQNILWEIGTCHIQFTEICFFLQRLGFFLCLKSLFFFLIVELLTAYNQNIWIYRAFPAVSHLQPCKIKTVILFFLLFLKMMPAPTLSCLWVEQFSDLELWIGQNHINWQLSLCHI